MVSRYLTSVKSMANAAELHPFTAYPPERMELEEHRTLDLHVGNRMIGPHVVFVGLMVKTGCFHSLEGNT